MSTQKTIVRKAQELSTRSLFDISSKVKAAAIGAAGTDAAAVGAFLTGTIGLHALIGIGVASIVPVIAAYAKTSSEDLEEKAKEAGVIAHELGAVVTAVAPQAAPVVAEVESGVDAVEAMLVAAAPVAPATTATIALSAPRPATAGGQ